MSRADVTLQRSELQAITDYADDYISLLDLDFRHLFVNRAVAQATGSAAEDFVGKTLEQVGMSAPMTELLTSHMRVVAATGSAETFEYEMPMPNGRRSMHTMLAPVKRADGSVQAIIAISRDVTQWRRGESLRNAQNEVMRAIAGGSTLAELMQMIVREAEAIVPGHAGSLLLVDDARRSFRPGCAPAVPAELVAALCAAPIAVDNGACGAAASLRRTVITADALNDPAWARHRAILERHGLAACWSQPILAQDGSLLGTFALYGTRARAPREHELAALTEGALIAAVAIRHRHTLDSLLEVSERYAALTEHAANIISVCDLDGRVLDTSPAIRSLLGYEPAEIIGGDSYGFVHPDDLELARGAFRKLREQVGTEAEATYRYRHKNGSWRVLETIAKSRLNQRGEYLAVINSRDVTEHERMTRALRESEGRLERALEASDLGIWDWDIDSGELYLDRHFAALMGYTESGPWRFDWLLEQVHPEDHGPLVAAFVAQLKGQTEFCEVEYRARTQTGEWKWIHARGQVTERTPPGRARRMTGTNRDITANKNLQDRLERALSASGLGMWDWDVQSGRLFVDARCMAILGYEDGGFGHSMEFLNSITHPDDNARNRAAIEAHTRGATPYYEIEVRARTAAGEWKWIRLRGQVTARDADGQALHLTGTMQDVDDPRRVKERLDSATQRIQLLLEATDEGIIGLDAGGVVSFVNPAAERMLGHHGEGLLGQRLFDVVAHVRENGIELAREHTPLHKCLSEGVRCRTGDDLFWRRGSHTIPVEYSVSPLFGGEGGGNGAVLIVHDVSEKRSMAHQLHFQALHDPLTGLINRRGFEARLNELLNSAKADNREHALAYLDLDQFKLVNDTCGHAAGDELLRQLPKVLQPLMRERDIIARLGGDEFAMLLQDCPLSRAAQIAESVRDAVRAFRFIWQYRTFTIGASIGVVGITGESQGLVAVLGAADTACYVAKDQGPNHVHVSYPHDLAIIRRRGEMRWIARLKNALEENRFCLYFQSISAFARAGERPSHHELLIRLLDAKGEVILPGAFIAAAERYQLMPVIDAWVVEHALRYIGEVIAPHEALRHHRFGINLSGESLRDATLLETIRATLARYRVPPTMLYFEITETAAISNLGLAVEFMRSLKQIGCELALDDFGSGMSSFSYLKHLPVDYLKIDGSFVKDILSNPVDQAIVRAINSVGQKMGIRTIAEYVESPMIAEALRAIGVDYAQGYGVAAPRPLEEFTAAFGGSVAVA